MVRKKGSPGIEQYYSAQEKMFSLHSEIMTGVLTHYGERGRNDEEYLKRFLSKILPKRFGIGSGFIVNSDPSSDVSNQTDIIIFDQLFNSPLYKELAAEVYPIETVFATIEVKGPLSKYERSDGKTDIGRTLECIAKVRQLANSKKYVRYKPVPINPDEPSKCTAQAEYFEIPLSPRSYIFVYTTKDWDTLDDFESYLTEKLSENRESHLHGIAILDKDWFVFQTPHTGDEVELNCYEGDCLLRFTNALLTGIQSIPMGIAPIATYHRLGLYNGLQQGDPTCSAYAGPPELFEYLDT